MSSSSSSRKGALSYDASLGACLSFAAQVLVSGLPASQVCTKDALSPMVVEAHRFGQQVGKLRGSTDRACSSTNPRKLLKRLQARPREPEEDSRLMLVDHLGFKDLTWDSHGDIDQTLEMELLELESRATEANISVCILLTLCRAAASPADLPASPEAAILWFPASDRQGGSGKKQLLLYVCPGRIKVVKSVPELLRKLLDESKLAGERGATYNVWTLSRASGRQDTKMASSNQRIEKKSSTDEREAATGWHSSAAITQQQRGPGSVHPEDGAARAFPSSSIFSFATTVATPSNQDERTKSAPQAMASPHRSIKCTESSSEEYPLRMPVPVDEPGSLQHAQPGRRKVISASFSGELAKCKALPDAHATLMWASFDSDLKKPLIPKRSSKEDTQNSDDAVFNHLRNGKQPSDLLSDAGAVDLSMQTNGESATHQIFELKQLESPIQGSEVDKNSIFAFARVLPGYKSEPDPQVRTSHHRTSVNAYPNAQIMGVSVEQQDISSTDRDIDNSVAFKDATSPTQEAKSINVAKQDQPCSVRNAPARKNYREKLGNRVWWELRCAAERLQHQQQAPKAAMNLQVIKCPPSIRQQQQQRVEDPITTEKSPRYNQLRVYSHSYEREVGSLRRLSRAEEAIPPGTDITSQSPSARRFIADNFKPTESSQEAYPWNEQTSDRMKHDAFMQRTTDPRASRDKTISESSKADSTLNECEARSNPFQAKHIPMFAPSLPFDDEANTFNATRLADTVTETNNNGFAFRSRQSPPLSSDRTVVAASLSDSYEIEYTDTKEYPDLITRASSKNLHGSSGEHKSQGPSVQCVPITQPATTNDDDDDDDDDDGDDDKLVHKQWATTHSSYSAQSERSPSLYAQQPEELLILSNPVEEQLQVAAKPRLNVFGSVPIRSRRSSPPKVQTPEIENESSPSEEEMIASPLLEFSPKPKRLTVQPDAISMAKQKRPDLTTSAIDKKVQYVATFIAVDTEVAGRPGASTSANQPSREEKLAELRRKKLQQLHKAREEQQQQQQLKKKAQRERIKSTLVAQPSIETDSRALGTTGFPLTKIAKRPSNKKLVQNALEFTLLAGGSMEKDRSAALAALALSSCDNFIVLLKSTKDLKFRALYEHHADREEVSRLFAATPNCPQLLTCDAIGQFFKYNSGKKEFVAIDSRSFTVKTDACALKDELVFKKRVAIGRLL